MHIEKHIPLASFTTIKLGGIAEQFCACASVEDIQEALGYAREHALAVHVLSGGSNTVFSDSGFRGLVIKVDLKGISFTQDGADVLVAAGAGESWDVLVAQCVARGLAGIECLSGIPGSVGATPVQNVGAYGQEVGSVVERVDAIERASGTAVSFTSAQCLFGYRTSRFKTTDRDRYIITDVTYRLRADGAPAIAYPQLQKAIEERFGSAALEAGKDSLKSVREVVLDLRRSKSMVVDPQDLNSVSSGSFFTNPILSPQEFARVQATWKDSGNDLAEIPAYREAGSIKIPAAWLVEQSGFEKGYTERNVGISEHHALALVNRGGTTSDLLALAAKIEQAVFEQFGIRLAREPNIIE